MTSGLEFFKEGDKDRFILEYLLILENVIFRSLLTSSLLKSTDLREYSWQS